MKKGRWEKEGDGEKEKERKMVKGEDE